ncbi:LytTR family DNA-binding domain-containing protein [Pedobacter aquatilis]|uniref:LytR/AlgR family response regulator transcription factor n=1 Tax=Pedobacter aquatilis TaxID=351343 RepID=UPI00292F9DF0|nr:LytTR family DNA-binding domain-containing protein [Pedobacter aquatilis]
MKKEKKISCIIVDDEPHAIEGLRRYIEAVPAIEIVNTYTDPIKAMMEISSGEAIDLVLLDVDMPGITGIELGESLKPKVRKLVFTTAHSKYAYEAFKVEADDFLLKPYSLASFLKTINKLFPQNQALASSQDSDDYMFIKSKEDNLRLIKIRYKDIVAVESKLNYIQIHTLDRSVTTYMSLLEMSKKLAQFEWFMQFQRSFIIAPEYIEYIEGNAIKMQNGTRITVGDYYKKYFNDFVDSKLIKARRK